MPHLHQHLPCTILVPPFYPSPPPPPLNAQLRDMSREVLRYERGDGVTLTTTLYLPPGYKAERDGALPCIMWAYPREFKSKVCVCVCVCVCVRVCVQAHAGVCVFCGGGGGRGGTNDMQLLIFGKTAIIYRPRPAQPLSAPVSPCQILPAANTVQPIVQPVPFLPYLFCLTHSPLLFIPTPPPLLLLLRCHEATRPSLRSPPCPLIRLLPAAADTLI